MKSPAFYGLLIGIDNYLPNTLSDHHAYPPLYGCVHDVQQVEIFFHRRLHYAQKHIRKLIAPHHEKGKQPQISTDQQPTYKNMSAELQSIISTAQAGDVVWIYYAGHGGRTPTLYKQAKGSQGIDEVLVPVDIGDKGSRYLHDVELGYLLKKMVDKGLIVTLVLDCCHSGSATRGNDNVTIRGIGRIDTTLRPIESQVASLEELSRYWLASHPADTRGFEISSGWLLPPLKGYVLLAACRDFEAARESRFDGKWQNGVFTHHLLEALCQIVPESTYRMLYDRVRAKMHAQFIEQTPQLEGERDRVVFSSEVIEQTYTVNVLDVQPQKDFANTSYYVELDAGQLHTLQEGAQFWIYPNPARIHAPADNKRLAHIEISELGAARSRAVLSAVAAQHIEVGDQALLITPAPLRFSRKVRLVHQRRLPHGIDQAQALRRAEEAIQQHNGTFIRLAHAGEIPDFLVTVTPQGHYEIQEADRRPLPYIRPVLPITLAHAAEKLVERMIHLAKYYNVMLLENQSGPASLVGKLHVELRRKHEDEKNHWRSEAGTSLILEPGEKVNLVISHNSWIRLHVAVLDLAHNWSIQQIFPKYNTITIEPNQPLSLPLEAVLTDVYRQGTDTLKIFASQEVTDFSGLNLPQLDQPHIRNRLRSRSGNALEALLEIFHDDEPDSLRSGGLRILSKAEWEWTSAQVEVYIRRRQNT
jgi:Caspase domain